MLTLKTLLPAAALAAGLTLAASANAAIFIGVSTDGGATITTIGSSGSNTSASGSGVFGVFTINNVSATGDVVHPDLLSSNSLNTSTAGAGTLDVYVLETDLAASSDTGGFVSSLTSNTLPAGWAVTESTFFSASNDFAGRSLLASTTFTNIGTDVIGSAANPLAPYALVEQYHIVASGSGTANSTIDIASVPEPATWAMMLVGFGGLGAMLRSNRRRTAAVAA